MALRGVGVVKPLTPPQRKLLDYIQEIVAERSYPPSIREICADCGWSSLSTAHLHLQALVRKGYLKVEPGKPRAMTVVVKP